MGPVAPRHVGSSQTRARTRVPCIGRQTLNHCATREALGFVFKSWGQRQERRKVLPAECKCLNPFKIFLPWKFSQIAWAEPVFEYSSAVCIHLMPPPFPTGQRSPQLLRLTLRHWLTLNAPAYFGSFGSKSSPRSQRSAFQAALFFFFNKFIYLFIYFIYLFMAVLGLRFCARAFSSCGEWGPLFIAVRGPLSVAASPVAEHRLQTRRLSNCGSRA